MAFAAPIVEAATLLGHIDVSRVAHAAGMEVFRRFPHSITLAPGARTAGREWLAGKFSVADV